MTPTEANNEKITNDVFENISQDYFTNDRKAKYKVGDVVRVASQKLVFDNGYKGNWSTEIFEITTIPPTYKIRDAKGDELSGTRSLKKSCRK